MKKRIITAAVLIPVLILVALVAPTIVAAVVWGLLLAVGAWSFRHFLSAGRRKCFTICAGSKPRGP